MAVRKNAKKTTKKSDAFKLSDIKLDSKTKKLSSKALARTSTKVLAFALATLFVGLLLGAGAWWIVCRNDCFALLGQEEVTLTVDEAYADEGVSIVAFGRDETASVFVETNLKKDAHGNLFSDEVGKFYIIYKSSCFKYGKLFAIQKVRLVSVVEASEGGE